MVFQCLLLGQPVVLGTMIQVLLSFHREAFLLQQWNYPLVAQHMQHSNYNHIRYFIITVQIAFNLLGHFYIAVSQQSLVIFSIPIRRVGIFVQGVIIALFPYVGKIIDPSLRRRVTPEDGSSVSSSSFSCSESE